MSYKAKYIAERTPCNPCNFKYYKNTGVTACTKCGGVVSPKLPRKNRK